MVIDRVQRYLSELEETDARSNAHPSRTKYLIYPVVNVLFVPRVG
jgi:hypothetical protein